MALPTYVGAAAESSGLSTIVPGMPTAIVPGDILLLVCETANETVSISDQAGGTWTAVTNSPQGTGTAGGVSSALVAVFWSRYNGTQTAPTVADSGDHTMGRIFAFRGVKGDGDPWNITSGGVDATSDTSLDVTGATTTVVDCLVVICVSLMDDAQDFGATWTNADLGSITVRQNTPHTAGNDGRHIVLTGTKAVAGSYTTTTNTLTASSTKGFITIALAPEETPDGGMQGRSFLARAKAERLRAKARRTRRFVQSEEAGFVEPPAPPVDDGGAFIVELARRMRTRQRRRRPRYIAGQVFPLDSRCIPKAATPVQVVYGPFGGATFGNTIQTVTANAGTDELTTPGSHGLAVDDQVAFTTDNTLPAPLVVGTTYYVHSAPTGTTFKVSATLGGGAIDLTDTGTGTHNVDRKSWHVGLTVDSSSDRAVVVHVTTVIGVVTGVKYGGGALTLLSSVTNDIVDLVTNQSGVRTEIWYVLNPSVGTADVVVTTSTPIAIAIQAGALRNVHQATPFGTVFAGLNGPDPPPTTMSLTVTGTTSGGLVIDSCGYEAIVAAKPTADAGQTDRGEGHIVVTGVDIWARISEETSTPTSNTVGWSSTQAAAWVQIAVEVKPVSTPEVICPPEDGVGAIIEIAGVEYRLKPFRRKGRRRVVEAGEVAEFALIPVEDVPGGWTSRRDRTGWRRRVMAGEESFVAPIEEDDPGGWSSRRGRAKWRRRVVAGDEVAELVVVFPSEGDGGGWSSRLGRGRWRRRVVEAGEVAGPGLGPEPEPEPEPACYPRVGPAPASFTRVSAVAATFAKSAPVGAFDRDAPPVPDDARLSPPAGAYDRLPPPECDSP